MPIIKEATRAMPPKHVLADALWWVQRWVSGSIDDPDWEEGERVNSFTLEEAFEVLRSTNDAHLDSGLLWRGLAVGEEEGERLLHERTLLPHERPFQSFTTSFTVAEEFVRGNYAHGDRLLVVSVKPTPESVVFSLRSLLESKAGGDWMAPLADWFWQEEIVLKVDRPLPVNGVVDLSNNHQLGPLP